jgi:hypothetical protein
METKKKGRKGEGEKLDRTRNAIKELLQKGIHRICCGVCCRDHSRIVIYVKGSAQKETSPVHRTGNIAVLALPVLLSE